MSGKLDIIPRDRKNGQRVPLTSPGDVKNLVAVKFAAGWLCKSLILSDTESAECWSPGGISASDHGN